MNYISIFIYAVLLVSFLPGIRIAPRGKLRYDSLSFDAMTALKGMMALFVLFHHISQNPAFQQTNTISFFQWIGFLFVGVFFFSSGYGLYKSFCTKPDYLNGFLRKRVLPLVCSYYVMVLIYTVYYIIVKPGFTAPEWILKCTGLVLINSQSWYVYVIVILYVLFYFVFKNEKMRKYAVPVFLITSGILGLLFVFLNHFPWYIGEPGWWKNPGAFDSAPWWKKPCALPFEGEWWINSTVCFAGGLFIAKHEAAFTAWVEKKYPLKLLISAAVCALFTVLGFYCLWHIGYWTEFSGKLGMLEKLVCFIAQSLQALATVGLLLVIMKKVYVKNRFYTFLGKHSLEVYLMQELVLFSWSYIIETPGRTAVLKPGNIALYALLVVVSVLAGAIIYRAVNVQIAKKLKG